MRLLCARDQMIRIQSVSFIKYGTKTLAGRKSVSGKLTLLARSIGKPMNEKSGGFLAARMQ